ncbi:MAG: endonuclease domain-containing protein [Tunicatimonas sp.]
MKHNHHYNKKLKTFARAHRNQGTKAEVRLWCELLRKRQMMGFPFLRQRPIDNYIADFFCKELKLIIETDGISHSWEGAAERDQRRTEDLAALGYTVLRFEDEDVMKNIDYVRETIENWIENHPPTPFKGGRYNG